MPLLYGPVEQLWDFEAAADAGWSAEFCRTVADCPKLLAVRSWHWLLAITMLTGAPRLGLD